MSPSANLKSSEWRKLRKEIIERDEYTCQDDDCGRDLELVASDGIPAHVHHIEPASDGGSDDPENLITLCKDCHFDRHAKIQFETLLETFHSVEYPALHRRDVKYIFNCGGGAARRALDGLVEQGELGKFGSVYYAPPLTVERVGHNLDVFADGYPLDQGTPKTDEPTRQRCRKCGDYRKHINHHEERCSGKSRHWGKKQIIPLPEE